MTTRRILPILAVLSLAAASALAAPAPPTAAPRSTPAAPVAAPPAVPDKDGFLALLSGQPAPLPAVRFCYETFIYTYYSDPNYTIACGFYNACTGQHYGCQSGQSTDS